jgi:ComF family protein
MMPMARAARGFLCAAGARFFDLLLPRTCAGCRTELAAPDPLCASCQVALVPCLAAPEVSGAGGAPVPARALFLHAGPARELVHALKYRGRRDVARFFAGAAAARFGAEMTGAVFVPIPLHPRRERKRGYNQSFLFATALAAAIPDSAVVSALIRRRATRTQTDLRRAARAANVAGAFGPARRATLPDGSPVILVDDVVTTGSTLGEAAAVLDSMGVSEISVLAAAWEA